MTDELRNKIQNYIEWIKTQADSSGYLDSQYRAQIDAFEIVLDWIDELPRHESDTLPEWAIAEIKDEIEFQDSECGLKAEALYWVLDLRKPEEK